jgi:hypothetical protein
MGRVTQVMYLFTNHRPSGTYIYIWKYIQSPGRCLRMNCQQLANNEGLLRSCYAHEEMSGCAELAHIA